MKKLLLILFIGLAQGVFAQTPVLQALVSKEMVEVNGHLTISFRFNASGENFIPPSNMTKNFRVLSGPNKSTEMSYMNGSMSSSISYSYVISPVNTGTFTIEPASIKSDDKVYKSQKVKIKVVKPQSNAQKEAAQQEQNQKNESKQLAQAKKDLFLKLVVNKKSAYQGEQILATYKLYNRTRLNGIEGQRLPEFDGFYTSDIEVNNQNNHSRENVNGVVYDVFVLKKTILIPQKSGELMLIPLEVDANIQIQESKPVNTWFGPRYQFKNKTVQLKSNAVKIKVKPLPSGAPNSFNGAVGKFKYVTKLSPENLKVNDAITYTVKISGTGNLPLLDHPMPTWPSEIEVYDPKTKSNINNKTNVITGSKTWEYLAIPRNGGTYEIAGTQFTYFNPASKKYVTISAPSYSCVVEKGTGSEVENESYSVNKQNLARINTDIRFVHTNNPNLRMTGDRFFGSVWFYFWMIAPIIIGVIGYLVLKRQTNLNSDTVGLKRKKATKMAKKHLKEAKNLLNNGEQNDFYDAVFKALNGYVSDKLNIPNSSMNKSIIESKMIALGIQSDTLELFKTTIDHCEMARFAPVASISNTELLSQAQNVIIKLEDELG